jgi:hypothetical protein
MRAPDQFANLLGAMEYSLAPSVEVVIIGGGEEKQKQELVFAANSTYFPNKVVLAWPSDGGDSCAELKPILSERKPVDGKPAAYVCRNFSCDSPVTDGKELAKKLML